MKKATIAALVLLIAIVGCSKNNSDSSNLYVPTSADVTSKATLTDLQKGRVLYIANCGSCHGLHSPDSYSISQWATIIKSMGPKTDLSSSDMQLVTKYVTRGK